MAQLRDLLQTQAVPGGCPTSTPQLAGISVPGWIVISVLIGLVTGVLSTLLYQRCCRRPRADPQPAAASALYSTSSSLRLTPQGHSSINLHSKTPLPASAEPFFSPLRSSTQLAPGSLAAAASGLDVGKGSTPSGSDTLDTRSAIIQDQQPVMLQMQALGSWRHQAPLHETLTVLPEGGSADSSPDPYRYHLGGPYGPPSSRSTSITGSSPGRPGSGGMGRPPAAGGMPLAPGMAHNLAQQYAAVTSITTAAAAGAGAAGAAPNASIPEVRPDSSGMGRAGGQHSQQQRPPPLPLPQQQDGASAAPPTAGAGAAASPGARSEGLEGVLTPRSAVESEYEVDELDADWKALLGGVDKRLAGGGLPPLDARERAIAMRTLLAATHSRGAEAAMQATVEEVVRFRAFQAQRQQ